MALAWTLRLPGGPSALISALISASSVKPVEENVAALNNLSFSEEELKRIDALLDQ